MISAEAPILFSKAYDTLPSAPAFLLLISLARLLSLLFRIPQS